MSGTASGLKQNKILVRKASGEEEPFAPLKLESSLRNAGAGDDIISEIIADISEWIYNGVTTKKIYSRAFQLLKRIRNVTAIRYKLKQAMFELGPTGYPFEHFIGELFRIQGFDVLVGQTLEGQCVTHEMDVIATKDHHQNLVECKFRQDQGKITTVQTPLYVKSRIDDIISRYSKEEMYVGYTFTGWVVTNTRFSSDSVSYAECIGLRLLGWDYPAGEGLKHLIEKERLYPVTALTRITKREKQILLENGIVTCRQLFENPSVLDSIDFNQKKSTSLIKELNDILSL
jgi:Holliday junction resolvase